MWEEGEQYSTISCPCEELANVTRNRATLYLRKGVKTRMWRMGQGRERDPRTRRTRTRTRSRTRTSARTRTNEDKNQSKNKDEEGKATLLHSFPLPYLPHLTPIIPTHLLFSPSTTMLPIRPPSPSSTTFPRPVTTVSHPQYRPQQGTLYQRDLGTIFYCFMGESPSKSFPQSHFPGVNGSFSRPPELTATK